MFIAFYNLGPPPPGHTTYLAAWRKPGGKALLEFRKAFNTKPDSRVNFKAGGNQPGNRAMQG